MRQLPTTEDQQPVCPVGVLAGQISRLVKARNAAERAGVAARSDDGRTADRHFERAHKIDDAISELEVAASYLRATSPRGAMLQVALVRMHGEALNPTINYITKERRTQCAEAVVRLAYSLCAFIEGSSGESRDEDGLEYYFGTRFDYLAAEQPNAEAA